MTKNAVMREIEIREVCLLAGKIMLESGAETYRVEDTMVRIAASYGAESAESYVTPTAIIFTLEGEHPTKTKMIRIITRGTDLNKVALVNNLSREIHNGKWTVSEAYQLLKEIEKKNVTYPIWIQIFAAAIASACFVIMFGGRWGDFLPALIAGGIGYSWFIYIDRFVHIRFFSEFSASLFIASCAVSSVYFGFGEEVDKIIIGSVMPLVPGLLITNAIRDLMAGHLIAGLAKGAEAVLTAFAIGSGVAVILILFS
ncbi:threonine/serine exporter family protein [Fervidibacillus albus]|uniref:Threonine/serine exporter family protein n=1 Tax=Fervidibacillus albus TaxID=2980026 RepID=A0A9E8RX18_9BACI|nr:threonine/serine exporter family protein [Fervidibacillus albus]WAA09047.1 threonine/serine exporter family protein [Fervidibacillus albus]